MFTFVDAFSGAGGLSLGLQNAGMKPLLSFDLDPFCIETQRKNPKYLKHPCVQIDINDLLHGNWKKNYTKLFKNLTLLAGGPPCQGFSVQRIGKDKDSRNELILSFIKLACEIRPSFFLMENVAGLKGRRGLHILNKAIKLAESNGFFIHKAILDAQDYGVPQRRKRIFVIGEYINNGTPVFEFPKPISKKTTVRQAIGHLPDVLGDHTDHPKITHHIADKLSELNKKRLKALSPGQGMEDLPLTLRANCHKNGALKIGHRNVYGRMAWDDVAPTITARFDSFTRGQFGHPYQLRSISLREGAILQTFPSDFLFVGNKIDIARQIGNAIPPIFAEKLGIQIINAINKKMKKNHSIVRIKEESGY